MHTISFTDEMMQAFRKEPFTVTLDSYLAHDK